jgi:sulfate adenylyltransferase
MSELISPLGGVLRPLLADLAEREAIRGGEVGFPSIDLSWRQICRLELLLCGALSPLTGYMGRNDLERVLRELRLADGTPWPEPMLLAVDAGKAQGLSVGQRVALRDGEGFLLAVLDIAEMWPAEPEAERALASAGGAPLTVPLANPGQVYLAGAITGTALPQRQDFATLRKTPGELRSEFTKRGWRKVIAYQASQPLHRVHVEFLNSLAARHKANVLVQINGGADVLRDAEHFGLVSACRAIMPRFPGATTLLAISPLMPAQPSLRETLLKAVIARNFGCQTVVVGGESQEEGTLRRGGDSASLPSTGPLAECAASLGIDIVPFPRMVYVEDRDEYFPQDSAPTNSREQVMGGEELKRRLIRGLRIPEWMSYPEVLEAIARAHPPRHRQGFTVFFTGLSGAGKSTVARALAVRLTELGGRRVTLLDGDLVRRNLSSELGFSREHRDLNIRRIGFVAEEITKHGGIAICAPIAPYGQTRQDVRRAIEPWGGFIEIHMATPIEVCERRDRKGLYAKARAGLIREFTGVSDPYEAPEQAELVIDTSNCGVEEAVQSVVLKLEHEGYLR